MKVIFTDWDGVLNSGAWAREACRRMASVLPPFTAEQEADGELEPAKIALLNQAIERTGAKVVVSSSWRGADDETRQRCLDIFYAGGLMGEVVGQTPHARIHRGMHASCRETRAAEIRAWLADHPEVTAFAILEDEHIGWEGPEMVRTSGRYGIEQEHVEQVVALLSGGQPCLV